MTINNKYISKRREKEAAKDIGGRAHPGSGCFWSSKSDASNDIIQLEDKFTKDTKYSLQLSILKKIEKEAYNVGKIPVLRFGFIDLKQFNKEYCVIHINHCKEELHADYTFSVKGKSITLHADRLYYMLHTSDKNYTLQVEFIATSDIYYIILWDYLKDNYQTLF